MSGIHDLPLLEALHGPGCVLCSVAKKGAEKYLRDFVHESINHAGARSKLVHAWGFCSQHDRYVYEYDSRTNGSALGYAIVVESVIGSIKGRIAKIQSDTKPKMPSEPRGKCPACERGRFWLEFIVRRLPACIATPPFRAWRSRGGRLCWHHLLRCAEVAAEGEPLMHEFVSTEIRLLDELLVSLKEYIRKHDHQYAAEAKGSEQDAPTQALRFFDTYRLD